MIKKIAGKAIAASVRAAARLGLFRREIIVRVDGGLCSQMHFYLIGEMLRRRGNKVGFDLLWFDEWGKDCDGVHARNFDLLKLFPDLTFTCAGRIKSTLMRLSFPDSYDYFAPPSDPLEWLGYRGPMYMRGYYRDPDEMYPALFREVFIPSTDVLDAAGRKLLEKIDSLAEASAVHVRRGDLAVANPAYGSPATPAYFVDAMQSIAAEHPDAEFFIFSDEPQWCRDELLPLLPPHIKAEIVEGNGSDKGYVDLLLMSRCRNVVCSQGSMGRFAALMRPDALTSGTVILLPGASSAGWLSHFPNARFPDSGS